MYYVSRNFAGIPRISVHRAGTNDIHGLATVWWYAQVLLQPQTMCSATRTLNSTIAAVVDMNLATFSSL